MYSSICQQQQQQQQQHVETGRMQLISSLAI
jgi:hypothetical protein